METDVESTNLIDYATRDILLDNINLFISKKWQNHDFEPQKARLNRQLQYFIDSTKTVELYSYSSLLTVVKVLLEADSFTGYIYDEIYELLESILSSSDISNLSTKMTNNEISLLFLCMSKRLEKSSQIHQIEQIIKLVNYVNYENFHAKRFVFNENLIAIYDWIIKNLYYEQLDFSSILEVIFIGMVFKIAEEDPIKDKLKSLFENFGAYINKFRLDKRLDIFMQYHCNSVHLGMPKQNICQLLLEMSNDNSMDILPILTKFGSSLSVCSIDIQIVILDLISLLEDSVNKSQKTINYKFKEANINQGQIIEKHICTIFQGYISNFRSEDIDVFQEVFNQTNFLLILYKLILKTNSISINFVFSDLYKLLIDLIINVYALSENENRIKLLEAVYSSIKPIETYPERKYHFFLYDEVKKLIQNNLIKFDENNNLSIEKSDLKCFGTYKANFININILMQIINTSNSIEDLLLLKPSVQNQEILFNMMISSVADNGKFIELYNKNSKNKWQLVSSTSDQALTQEIKQLNLSLGSNFNTSLSIIPNIPSFNEADTLQYNQNETSSFLKYNEFLLEFTFQISRYILKYMTRIALSSYDQMEIYYPSIAKQEDHISAVLSIEKTYKNYIQVISKDIKSIIIVVFYLKELATHIEDINDMLNLFGHDKSNFSLIQKINNIILELLERVPPTQFFLDHEEREEQTQKQQVIGKFFYEWLNFIKLFINKLNLLQTPNLASILKKIIEPIKVCVKSLLDVIKNNRINFELVDSNIAMLLFDLIGWLDYNEIEFKQKILEKKKSESKIEDTALSSTSFFRPILNVLYKKLAEPKYFCRKQSLAQFITGIPNSSDPVVQKQIEEMLIEYCVSGELPDAYLDNKAVIIYKAVNDLVERLNVLTMNCYFLLNNVVLNLMENEKITKIDYLFNSTTIGRAFICIGKPSKSAVKPIIHQDFKNAVEQMKTNNEFTLLDRSNTSSVQMDVINIINTSINNHLGYNFNKLFRKFLKLIGFSTTDVKLIISTTPYDGNSEQKELACLFNKIYRLSCDFRMSQNALFARLKLMYTIQQYYARIKDLNVANSTIFGMIAQIKTLESKINEAKFPGKIKKNTNERKEKYAFLVAKTEHYVQKLKEYNFNKVEFKKAKKDGIFKELKYKDFKNNQASKSPSNAPDIPLNKLENQLESLYANFLSKVESESFFDNYKFNLRTDGNYLIDYFEMELTLKCEFHVDDDVSEDDVSDDEAEKFIETEEPDNDEEEQLNETDPNFEALNDDSDDDETKKQILELISYTQSIRKKYKKIKQFSLLPTSQQLSLKYIPFYNSSVIDLLVAVNKNYKIFDEDDDKMIEIIKTEPEEKETKEEKAKRALLKKQTMIQLTNKYFNTKKLLKKNEKLFYHGFETDGKAVSVRYSAKNTTSKKKSKKRSLELETDLKKTEKNKLLKLDIVAGDPGVSDTVFSFAKEIPSEKTNNYGKIGKRKLFNSHLSKNKKVIFFKMTKNQYYNDTNINNKIALMKIYNKHVNKGQINNIWQGVPNKRFTSSASLIRHSDYMNKYTKPIIRYYKVSPDRKWRYNTYINKKRYLLKFSHRYLKNSVVAIGDFSQSAEAKYKSRRGPIKYFKNFLLRHKYKLLNIDEFNTSKMCHKCLQVLGNFDACKRTGKVADNNDKSYKNAGCKFFSNNATKIPYSKLKVCRNCLNVKKTDKLIQNRDSNAALNIMRKCKSLLENKSFPPELDR